MSSTADLRKPTAKIGAGSKQIEVIAGLRKNPKELSPKWLYDEAGSQLFDLICESPEYYLTRTELEIMRSYADEIATAIGRDAAVIEFGSGTSEKTRLLLDHLDSPSVYIPVDIAREHLLEAVGGIARDYPDLAVVPLHADFTKPLILPTLARLSDRRVVYFPGSTLGNFEPAAAAALLQSMCNLAGPEGAALIGIDLQKDAATLERAYNDAAGVTARFNLNALRHANRVLGADFPLNAFEHRADWNAESSRIEMKLLCRRDVNVHIGSEVIDFMLGEHIRTELCHKYTVESFASLAAAAGLRIRRQWFDVKQQFSVHLLEPIGRFAWFSKELTAFRASLECLSPA